MSPGTLAFGLWNQTFSIFLQQLFHHLCFHVLFLDLGELRVADARCSVCCDADRFSVASAISAFTRALRGNLTSKVKM